MIIINDLLHVCFSIPPIISDKRTSSDRRVAWLGETMGQGIAVQPTRLTSSASSSSRVTSDSNSLVHSSPGSRKARRNDVAVRTRQAVGRNGSSRQVSETEKLQTNGVTNTLPSDVKLSPEVIVGTILTLSEYISVLFAFSLVVLTT